MIDPISIGIAFTAAQSAVSHIKQAIALGKDVNSLAGQFSKFFESADAVHKARLINKSKNLGKSDYELNREALEIAMHSDALREAERQLKDMIVWQLGKPQVWDHMLKERTRLFKERAKAREAAENLEKIRKKQIADQLMFAMYFISISVLVFAFVVGGIGIYGALEEKRIYEEKAAKARIERIKRAKAEAQDAIK